MRQQVNLGIILSLFFCLMIGTSFTKKISKDQNNSENEQITLGFVKVVDMAPLAIAKEKGFFEEEGLDVVLEAQSNWKNVINGISEGRLSGAMVFTSQAIATHTDFSKSKSLVNVCALGYSPTVITVSNDIWKQMEPVIKTDEKGEIIRPFSAESLRPYLDLNITRRISFGISFPVSTENYHLRYWLADGGIHPGFYSPTSVRGSKYSEVAISVTPPSQMPGVLEYEVIDGFSTSEPWNQQAYSKKIGVPIISSHQIQSNLPSKSLSLSSSFVAKNKAISIKLVKAIIKACIWLDKEENREETVEILSNRKYVGTDEYILRQSFNNNDESTPYSFFKNGGTYPSVNDAIWLLTQMRRWGQINEHKSDKWYLKTAKEVQNNKIWSEAIKALKSDKKWKDEIITNSEKKTYTFMDGTIFTPKTPNDYLKKFKIGLK